MKTILKTSLIAAILTVTACTHSVSSTETDVPAAASLETAPGMLKVTVDGYKEQEGVISAALFNEAGYNGKAAPVRGMSVDVAGESVTLTFQGLAAGEYGIKLYHDIDKNGEMNTNAFGLPTEPYAFSNNALGSMGPAKWDAAKFTVTEAGTVTSISFK
ncbi:MAG: DUF2141 domain-containing protein [Hellea sp.]